MFPRLTGTEEDLQDNFELDIEELMEKLEIEKQDLLLKELKRPSLDINSRKKLLQEIKKIVKTNSIPKSFQSLRELPSDPQYMPLRCEDKIKLQDISISERELLRKKAKEVLVRKEMAVVILAAGDGRRLGCLGPKGFYQTSLPTPKTLLQLMIEMIKFISDWAVADLSCKESVITVYLLMNSQIIKEILQSLEAANYYGYNRICVHAVKCEYLLIDEVGQVLLKNPAELLKAGGGNGQMIELFKKNLEKLFTGTVPK